MSQKFNLINYAECLDRYCTNCGQTVKNRWRTCSNQLCHQDLTVKVPYPKLPEGWEICPGCKLVPIEPEVQNFCAICHHVTAAGRNWITWKRDFNREIIQAQENFRQQYGPAKRRRMEQSISHQGFQIAASSSTLLLPPQGNDSFSSSMESSSSQSSPITPLSPFGSSQSDVEFEEEVSKTLAAAENNNPASHSDTKVD